MIIIMTIIIMMMMMMMIGEKIYKARNDPMKFGVFIMPWTFPISQTGLAWNELINEICDNLYKINLKWQPTSTQSSEIFSCQWKSIGVDLMKMLNDKAMSQ